MSTYMRQFLTDIDVMNRIYKLPTVAPDAQAIFTRAINFKSILTKELSEIDEITTEAANLAASGNMTTADHLRLLTGMADLLGDIVVFCASEAGRYNIPLDDTLAIIMPSNFSKLGADGQPIIDNEGKFLKGPNYWKPEPMIARMLATKMGFSEVIAEGGSVVALNMDAVADEAQRTMVEVSGIDPDATTQEAAPPSQPSGSDSQSGGSHP